MKTLTLIILSLTFMGSNNTVLAQLYGGTAFAYIYYDKEYREARKCFFVAIECTHDTYEEAKVSLTSALNDKKSMNEEFSKGTISYSIKRCLLPNLRKHTYGGWGTVQVSEKDGNGPYKREIKVTAECIYKTEADVAIELQKGFEADLKYNEQFAASPNHHITPYCDD